MLVLPGPGIVTVLAGVAILALEFAWARRFLKKTRHTTDSLLQQLKLKKKTPDKTSPPEP
jgi:tellurite resistance protein TerC